ncbi:MAG TPA: tetratricopeptide repeat protein, partial [Methanospirillum sp.]|nr:tetratricopeptide repeat protein [Methanospirillum sp.]
DSHLPHLLLGLVYSTLDRHQEAVSSLEKAVSLSDEPDILFHYGRVLGACNQYEKALSVFSSLLIQRPWDSGAAEGYARSLYHLQRWDELIELCEKQRAYNPDNPFWVTTLARVWGWHMSDINKAVQILQEWTGRPAGTEIQLVLADLYVYAERYEEARDLLFSLLKVHPEDYQILFRYASLLAQIREFTCAAEQFEILLQMRSNDGNLSYLAGQSYEQAGDPDRALELFTSAITCIPDNAEIWLSRARVLFELGQYSEAAINAAQAASLNPDWSDAFLLKGLAEIYMEEYDKARISLTCVTTLDPDNPEGWRYLGDAFLHSGEEYAARICYERTLVLDPDDIQAQYGYKTCTDILAARSVTDQSEEPISNEHQ